MLICAAINIVCNHSYITFLYVFKIFMLTRIFHCRTTTRRVFLFLGISKNILHDVRQTVNRSLVIVELLVGFGVVFSRIAFIADDPLCFFKHSCVDNRQTLWARITCLESKGDHSPFAGYCSASV